MSNPYIAEIRIFPLNFAPRGFAACNGQILPISQFSALFSLIGTYYGGNGTSNFALPNLQGSAPMHQGIGSGLTQRDIGETGGVPTVTLTQSTMPLHAHSFSVDPAAKAEKATTSGNTPSSAGTGNTLYSSSAPNVTMNSGMLALNGSSAPHNNNQPFLALNFCIALQGVYPVRS